MLKFKTIGLSLVAATVVVLVTPPASSQACGPACAAAVVAGAGLAGRVGGIVGGVVIGGTAGVTVGEITDSSTPALQDMSRQVIKHPKSDWVLALKDNVQLMKLKGKAYLNAAGGSLKKLGKYIKKFGHRVPKRFPEMVTACLFAGVGMYLFSYDLEKSRDACVGALTGVALRPRGSKSPRVLMGYVPSMSRQGTR